MRSCRRWAFDGDARRINRQDARRAKKNWEGGAQAVPAAKRFRPILPRLAAWRLTCPQGTVADLPTIWLALCQAGAWSDQGGGGDGALGWDRGRGAAGAVRAAGVPAGAGAAARGARARADLRD